MPASGTPCAARLKASGRARLRFDADRVARRVDDGVRDVRRTRHREFDVAPANAQRAARVAVAGVQSPRAEGRIAAQVGRRPSPAAASRSGSSRPSRTRDRHRRARGRRARVARRGGTTGASPRRPGSARRARRVPRAAARSRCRAPRSPAPRARETAILHRTRTTSGTRSMSASRRSTVGRRARPCSACSAVVDRHAMQAPVPEESTAIDAPRPGRHRVRAPRRADRRGARSATPGCAAAAATVRRRGSRADAGARRPPAGRLRACGHAAAR